MTESPKGALVFAKDVGVWDADVTVTPQPGAAPQVSKGVLNARLIAGGKWLVTDFRNETTGFEGHGLYGFDAATGRYSGTWVDDTRSKLLVSEGEWNPEKRTMTFRWSASVPDGRTMTWIDVTETIRDGEQIFRTLVPMPDGSSFEMMRAHYRRR